MEQRITVRITTGNDAFVEDPGAEVARILRDAADRVQASWHLTERVPSTVIKLLDINGNSVGSLLMQDAVLLKAEVAK